MANDTIPGGRRLPKVAGPPVDVVRALAAVDTTDLSDAMQWSLHMEPSIKALWPGMPGFAGTAVTVTVPNGSQEVRRVAMDMAGPGDVLVVDARGVMGYAVLGGNLAKNLKKQGLAGVVIDGVVRDWQEIQGHGLPVFCRGFTMAASPKTGPGEVNVPVACGGVVVQPGDVIVADSNGVIVVPRDGAAALAAKFRTG